MRLAEFLIRLAEFDRREGYAALGYPSLWAFCAAELGLKDGAIWFRTESTKCDPAVSGGGGVSGGDGRLGMVSIVLMRTADDGNASELFEKASNRSKRTLKRSSLRSNLGRAKAMIRSLPPPRVVNLNRLRLPR